MGFRMVWIFSTPNDEGQGQTLKTLKSKISKTVRDKEMLSIEVKQEVK